MLKNYLDYSVSNLTTAMPRDIISLDDLTPNNIGVFKRINQVSLATSYPEQWYKDSLNSDQIVKLAFYSELPVGAIKGKTISTSHRSDSYESTQNQQLPSECVPNAVYLESFAVLEAYRNLGIGAKLLQFVVEETKKKFIHEIVLHVNIADSKVMAWYMKHGFTKSGEVQDYYKEQGLPNPDAVILSLKV